MVPPVADKAMVPPVPPLVPPYPPPAWMASAVMLPALVLRDTLPPVPPKAAWPPVTSMEPRVSVLAKTWT